MFIYKITNKVNNKIYIGKTEQKLEKRFQQHIAVAKSNPKYHIHFAINKYGEKNFEIKTIETLDNSSDIFEREKYWINRYHSFNHDIGYNNTPLSMGGKRINPMSKETRAKISKAHKGRIKSPEHLKNIGNSNKGRLPWNKGKTGYHIHSQETKKKITEILKNRPPVSNETREKLRIANLGKTHSLETREKLSKLGKERPGRPHSQETKDKLSKLHTGKIVKNSTKEKLSKINMKFQTYQEYVNYYNSINHSNKRASAKMSCKKFFPEEFKDSDFVKLPIGKPSHKKK